MIDRQLEQAIRDRVAPISIMRTLDFHIAELSDGACRLTFPRDDRYFGIYESVHGGLLMTLADSAACFAIMTKTGPDRAMTTTDMNIRFLAPCRSDVTAVARAIKIGRTLCPVHVDLVDAAGTLVAVAQVTYMLLGERRSRKANPAERPHAER